MGRPIIAVKTLAAIGAAMEADQGASYREWLGRVLPHIGDAYSNDTFPFRSHMGASLIGDECARKIWYGWRWVKKPKHEGRLLRLFNRGHLEEGRFIASLLMIGCQVYQQDEHGKQFRISAANGHFGGSGDGVVVGLPDLPEGMPALCEFKTHNDKSFTKLGKEGVRSAKFEHFVQMQCYMLKMGIGVALYMAVNKNNDEYHAELVHIEPEIGQQFVERGERLVATDRLPTRISDTPGWFACKWCDYRPVCHLKAEVLAHCRTCAHSQRANDGQWVCGRTGEVRDKHAQLAGCDQWEKGREFC